MLVLWQTTLMKGRGKAPACVNSHLTHSGWVSSSEFSESEPSWAKLTMIHRAGRVTTQATL